MLQADEHLKLMLASEPGEVASDLTVDGLPRIFRAATLFFTPVFAPHIGREASARLAEWLARVVISYFLAPSRFVDLSDDASAAAFVPHLRPARVPTDPYREVVVMSSTEELIGRADVNDVEAILAITNTDVDEVTHAVADNADALFTWDYTLARPALRKLYEKAKTGQWNATTDLPWETEVDQEAIVVANNDQAIARGLSMDNSFFIGSPVEKWGDKEWVEFGMEQQNWTLSQFLHGEQGALLCTAKIVETVPWYDAKLYASTQVMDEARHVEVFARYLDEKLTGHYPINAHLRLLLDDIVNDSRWDMTYLGMQIMVEGLALAAFGFMHQMTTEPLLKQLLRYVMSDEARHVAFGVLSLKEIYEGMSAKSCASARSSPSRRPCACATGSCPRRSGTAWASSRPRSSRTCSPTPTRTVFQQMLFSKIVPNCKKLGLLDAADGWLRDRFTEIGVIQFEDWVDTGEEYGAYAARSRPTPEPLAWRSPEQRSAGP